MRVAVVVVPAGGAVCVHDCGWRRASEFKKPLPPRFSSGGLKAIVDTVAAYGGRSSSEMHMHSELFRLIEALKKLRSLPDR